MPHQRNTPFRIGNTLGDSEPGDKIGLQVLYSPAMIEQMPINGGSYACRLHATARRDCNAAFLPMTSNRIEFAVTKAMLLP